MTLNQENIIKVAEQKLNDKEIILTLTLPAKNAKSKSEKEKNGKVKLSLILLVPILLITVNLVEKRRKVKKHLYQVALSE
jgi:hypothetical protein